MDHLNGTEWNGMERTSNFCRGASYKCSNKAANDADTETAQTDCEKRSETKGVLLAADVAIHRCEGDHHRVQHHRHGI